MATGYKRPGAALGRSGGGPATKPLAGRVALVTGSTRGLGRTVAARLAAEGASLVVTGRETAAVDAAVHVLRDDGAEVTGIAADLSQPAEAHRLAAAAVGRAGRIDILVNNAGMSLRGNAWEVTDAAWEEQVNVNLRTPFILAQHAARSMIQGGRGGRIVNVSTIGAHASLHDAAVYDSAKAGLEGLTRDLAHNDGFALARGPATGRKLRPELAQLPRGTGSDR